MAAANESRRTPPTTMPVLVTGVTGQLGDQVAERLPSGADVGRLQRDLGAA